MGHYLLVYSSGPSHVSIVVTVITCAGAMVNRMYDRYEQDLPKSVTPYDIEVSTRYLRQVIKSRVKEASPKFIRVYDAALQRFPCMYCVVIVVHFSILYCARIQGPLLFKLS